VRFSEHIKAVLFDMDGVLIDARDWHFHALNEALAPFGYFISKEDHDFRFNGLSTSAKLAILTEEFGFPRSLHDGVSQIKQDRTLRLAGQYCFPRVDHLILMSRLKKRGFAIGVVTNSIKSTATSMLGMAQLLPLIDVLITNQDVRNQKPHPEPYVLACESLRVKPSAVLVIEDGDYGFQSATEAGCNVLRVNSPSDVSIENLLQYLPNLVGETQ
jgi:HAD superfamily hydrolase (TIGR01509 family)